MNFNIVELYTITISSIKMIFILLVLFLSYYYVWLYIIIYGIYIFFQGDRVLGVTLLGGFAEECVVEQSVRNLPLWLL